MLKFLYTRLALIALVIFTVNCVNSRNTVSGNYDKSKISNISDQIATVGSLRAASAPGAAAVPHIRIYRTSGDYSDNVPVGLSGDRSYLVSFPAVSDITSDSRPIKLEGGYLLDRRGIKPTSAFTAYTYSDYSSLKDTPRPAELLGRVIPGSRVTEIVEMPYHVSSDIASDTTLCNTLIRRGLTGCKVIYSSNKVPED